MNPYQVLGVSEGASAEEINRAYKQKMAYYGSLEEDTAAQVNALNDAYDALMYSGAVSYSTPNPSNRFGDVRAKIRENRLEDASTILDGVPMSSRDGEWYFLYGTIYKKRGWLEDAAECFAKAYKLEPGNAEFKDAFDAAQSKREGEFRNDWRQSSTENSGCTGSVCKLCTALACCDCLCSFFR